MPKNFLKLVYFWQADISLSVIDETVASTKRLTLSQWVASISWVLPNSFQTCIPVWKPQWPQLLLPETKTMLRSCLKIRTKLNNFWSKEMKTNRSYAEGVIKLLHQNAHKSRSKKKSNHGVFKLQHTASSNHNSFQKSAFNSSGTELLILSFYFIALVKRKAFLSRFLQELAR